MTSLGLLKPYDRSSVVSADGPHTEADSWLATHCYVFSPPLLSLSL